MFWLVKLSCQTGGKYVCVIIRLHFELNRNNNNNLGKWTNLILAEYPVYHNINDSEHMIDNFIYLIYCQSDCDKES